MSSQTANMRIRRFISISLLALVVTPFALPPAAVAQQLRSGGKRKIVAQVSPVYPTLARKMNLTGTVRLLAIVGPGGKVVRTEVLGGSPVLVPPAAEAVSKCRWETSPEESKEIVEIKFQPDAE
jgi:TonB-like protein